MIVSSYAHTQGGPTPIEDLEPEPEPEPERGYRPVRADSKTRLANILFTRALRRGAGDRLLAAACHPGASRTNLSADSSTLQSAAAGALSRRRSLGMCPLPIGYGMSWSGSAGPGTRFLDDVASRCDAMARQ